MKKSSETVLQGGELYAFRDNRNSCYRFAKVLAAYPEDGVVFIRTYKQRYAETLTNVKFAELCVGSLDDPDGLTIGCAPIAYASIHTDWLKSPDYGISEISEEEVKAVNETIDMMNEA